MKKLLLPLSLLVLAFLIWRELTPTPPAAIVTPAARRALREVQTPSLQPKPLPPAQQPNKAPSLGEPIAAPSAVPGERAKPPPNAVPFEMHEGLVVSYGDILLGRPTREDFPKQGFIEAPKPMYWREPEIGYSIDPQLANPDRVQRVIDYFNQNTPVRFVPFNNQKDSIVFVPSEVRLCLSYVGKIGGHQPIYLDPGCLEKEITHELMHALGFIHEHSRPDRDQYVQVNWEKIEEDKVSQFEVAPLSMAHPHQNRPFDYQSVMIYNPEDFAKRPGDQTIQSRTGAKIEPTPMGISNEDLARLVILYGR